MRRRLGGVLANELDQSLGRQKWCKPNGFCLTFFARLYIII